ncbi:hypothetical protein Bbelb_284550 [Branchiostoma belcheri]|nr:hypothetical protein Bbelb_284550 [Branchiostoma belcheri]
MKHLLDLGVRPGILPWIANFHSGRSQRTRYHGVLSESKQLTCGLAQGTKLGPIVFIAHTNSSTDNIQSPTWAFVDDLNLIESRLLSHQSRLQNDLNELSTWSDKNNMKLNPGKCKTVHVCFCRNPSPPPPLSINGHVLEVVKTAKCLGVTFQSDLRWDTHVAEVTKKGSQRLHLLCRLRQFNVPADDLVTVYTCFIRPVLEYGAPVWHPGLTTTQRRKIERIQRRATKIILGHYLPYDQSCKTLNLQTLHDRRETLCHQFGKTLSKSDTYNQWLPQQRGKVSGRVTRQSHKYDPLPARPNSSSSAGENFNSRHNIGIRGTASILAIVMTSWSSGTTICASRPANNNSPLARVSSWPPNFTGPTGPHSTGKGTLQGLARCDPRCLVEASRGDRHALPPHCLREARRAPPSGGSMYARRSAGAAAQDLLASLRHASKRAPIDCQHERPRGGRTSETPHAPYRRTRVLVADAGEAEVEFPEEKIVLRVALAVEARSGGHGSTTTSFPSGPRCGKAAADPTSTTTRGTATGTWATTAGSAAAGFTATGATTTGAVAGRRRSRSTSAGSVAYSSERVLDNTDD